MKAVVIFSGGQDSTTCLFWAKNQGWDVSAITFNYGQKHQVETLQAQQICMKHGIPQLLVSMDFLSRIADSALLSHGDVNKLNKKGLPSSFVPNRNQLFITLAHAYAQKIGALHLVTGVCQTDYSGYPDCRQEFINAIEKASNLGSEENILIHTPLMELTKGEIFMLAEKENCLQAVIEDSHTCYNGKRKAHNWGAGCGDCPACQLRRKGFVDYIALKGQ